MHTNKNKIKVLLTIDVEEYFHVFFGESSRYPEKWDSLTPEFPNMVESLRDVVRISNGKCVLFIVGWLAEKYPEFIKELSDKGAEIASHGYLHHPVYDMSEKEFSEDLAKSKKAIETAIKRSIRAYRAPGFSIGNKDYESLNLIREAGFTIDSSLLQSRESSTIGVPKLFEISQPAVDIFGRKIPTGGGAFFRLIPLRLFKLWHLKKRLRGEALNFYIHTWELYPSLKVRMPKMQSLIQYTNAKRVRKKLENFLGDCEFLSLDEYKAQSSDTSFENESLT
jgi:polysaccharide deacetylase family protein (PEP-CTERM system associated)